MTSSNPPSGSQTCPRDDASDIVPRTMIPIVNEAKELTVTRKSVIHIYRPIAMAVLELCRGGVPELHH